MSAIYDDAVILACKQKIIEPDWAKAICEMHTRMSTGFYDDKYLDAVLLKWRSGYDLFDAFAFLQVWAGMANGQIATIEINIGVEPESDKKIKENNQKLSSIENITEVFTEAGQAVKTGKVFHAEFWGKLVDCDGYVEWSQPIKMEKRSLDGETRLVEVPFNKVSLEVGFTTAGCTLFHLGSERGLARWAYNSSTIILFVVLDDNLFMPHHLKI